MEEKLKAIMSVLFAAYQDRRIAGLRVEFIDEDGELCVMNTNLELVRTVDEPPLMTDEEAASILAEVDAKIERARLH